jgi:hypothetical protein
MMEQRLKSRKRPCRICRKWFTPNPRVGDRQKTCGRQDCQDKWHAKRCAEWNGKNPSYFREIYLSKKLALVEASAEVGNPPPPNSNKSKFAGRQSPKSSQLPRNLIQEVIGAQHLVIIEYVTQLLFNSFQEETRRQLIGITRKLKQLPHNIILRGDSPQRGP